MWLVSGALLIAFATYVALPFGLAWYLPQHAAQYGIRLDVERVRVDPFSSRLSLSGVRIATSAESSIEWSDVETRVDIAELASGRLVLDRFRLSDAKLHAGDPGMGVSGVLPEVPTGLPEEVSVGELVVDGIELATVSEALGHPATVDWLRISSLDGVFRPDGAEIEADLSIGNGRSRLQGRLNLDETGWILNAAKVVANDVPLDGLPAVLGTGGSWRGRLDGAGPVRLVYSPSNGAFSATAGGAWAIEGLELGLAQVEILGARADWNGAAFMMSSGDAVNALSVDGEVGFRELRIDVADMLEVQAAELVLQVDASQAPEPRLAVEAQAPAARFEVRGGPFDGLDAEATNLVSQVALTIADDIGIEVDWLKSSALVVKLPADRSIDIEKIELESVVVEPGSNLVSAAAGTAERVDWSGFAEPRGTGTATRVAIQGIERHENGEFRVASASAETVEDRDGDSVLRLRDTALDAATFSPAGTLAVGVARISDVWLASEASTLVLERVTLDGVERTGAGTVRVAAGRVHLVDHALTGDRAIVGTDFELAGGAVSGRAWEVEHVRVGGVDIETGDASYTLRELALADATGEGERVDARLATLGSLELGFGGHRAVLEDLAADSPAWREGAGNARAIGASSIALDTVERHRWRASGGRLTGVETTQSGRATADAASVATLVLNAAGDSTTGAQRVELDGLAFDGESAVRAASAIAERTYFRSVDGSGIDVAGLRADAIDWDGETLGAGHGAALLVSATSTAVRASFDAVEFTSARLGAGGLRELGSLTSEFGRGDLDGVLEWSAGALALDGYHAPAYGERTLDFVETRNVEAVGDANETRLRADRAAARGTRLDASGAAVFATVDMDGVTLDGTHGRASASAQALRASPLAIRESALEIGALGVSGMDCEIGLSESGDWELPALPIGTGDARASFRVRIQEASTADPGSVMRITDRTTQPVFTGSIDIASAMLRGFDSGAIGVPARFSVDATADVFTALHIDGILVPTLTGTEFDLNATLHGLSLRAFSPYTQVHLGRPVEGGNAHVTIDATVRTSDLEAVADFTLSDVALGKSELPAATPGLGTEELSALDAALDSLRDEQGRIGLKVPLRGQLDSPRFDFDGLVVRALARAALETAQALPKAE